jgi:hypothetical protein
MSSAFMRRPSITTFSRQCLQHVCQYIVGNSPSLITSWGTNNLARFVPLTLERPILVKRLFCLNGSSVTGNVDMGIYSYDGGQIIAKGSTAHTGTSVFQFFDITDTWLSPGKYYLGVACSVSTTRIGVISPSARYTAHHNDRTATSAFALPASVTFAGSDNIIPYVGLELDGIL